MNISNKYVFQTGVSGLVIIIDRTIYGLRGRQRGRCHSQWLSNTVYRMVQRHKISIHPWLLRQAL